MSDYTKTTDFAAKDGLASGNANKAVVGTEIDDEFNNIATAVLTKYDSTDLASTVVAEGLSDTATLISPGTLNDVLQDNDGLAGDLQAITGLAAGGDKILFFDDTDDTLKALTIGTGVAITATTLATDDAAILHDSLSGFVADEHVAHSGVTVTAGSGMTGGGTIDATITLNVIGGNGITANANDIAITDQSVSTSVPVGFSSGALTYDPSSLTAFGTTTGVDLNADYVILEDAGVSKYCLTSQLVTPEVPTAVSGTTDSLTEADFGQVIRYSNATITVTLPNSLKTGFWATLLYTGTGTLTLTATGTLSTASSLTACTQQYGAITVFHAGSNVWYAWGSLDS